MTEVRRFACIGNRETWGRRWQFGLLGRSASGWWSPLSYLGFGAMRKTRCHDGPSVSWQSIAVEAMP